MQRLPMIRRTMMVAAVAAGCTMIAPTGAFAQATTTTGGTTAGSTGGTTGGTTGGMSGGATGGTMGASSGAMATGGSMTTGTTTTTSDTAATPVRQEEGHNYGWIGLLGLAGLAGLRRKEPTVVHRDPVRDTNPNTTRDTMR